MEDGAEAGFHLVEFDLMAELVVEAVEDLAFGGFEEFFVAVEEAVEDVAAVLVGADDLLAEFAVALAVGILDAAEVGAETHGELVDFADAFLGAGAIEDFEFAAFDLFEFVLESGDAGFEVGGAAFLGGVEFGFEVLNFTLYGGEAGGGGGHGLVVEAVEEGEDLFEGIGGEEEVFAFDDEAAFHPCAEFAAGGGGEVALGDFEFL